MLTAPCECILRDDIFFSLSFLFHLREKWAFTNIGGMGLLIATKLTAFGRECIPLFSETMVGLSTGHFLGVYCYFFFFFWSIRESFSYIYPRSFFYFFIFIFMMPRFFLTHFNDEHALDLFDTHILRALRGGDETKCRAFGNYCPTKNV